MTARARLVLQDCKAALADLKRAKRPETRRRRYVALVAYLRAVGHVLRHVDRESADENMRQAIDDAFEWLIENKSQNEIFWEFIDKERNNILKEFRMDAVSRSFTAFAGGQWMTIDVSATQAEMRPAVLSEFYGPPFVMKGSFEGEDVLSLAQRAIDWWNDQLDRIDADYRRRSS